MGVYVTPQGLSIPTVESLLQEMGDEQKANIDPLLNTDPDSPIGQLNGPFASHLRDAWEVLDIAYKGNDPETAEDALLENLCAITGTVRASPTRSRFVGTRKLKINLNAGVTVPANTTKFSVAGDDSIVFHTTESVTSVGAGDYYIAAECDNEGPVIVNAGTLTVIVTPVSGLNSVINEFDAIRGTTADNNSQLRLRRQRELRSTGSGATGAIRAKLLAYETEEGDKPILDAIVFENVNDFTDVNGLPPHSMEPLVYDGVSMDVANNDIAQILWNNKPGGIPYYGTTSGTAVDSTGANQTVYFTRPAILELIFQATVTLINVNQVVSQYEDLIIEAIIAEYTKRAKAGGLVRCNHYESAVLRIPGIEDCVIQIGFLVDGLQAPGVNLQLGLREIGFVQSSGIAVV